MDVPGDDLCLATFVVNGKPDISHQLPFQPDGTVNELKEQVSVGPTFVHLVDPTIDQAPSQGHSL
jgi:hypothetical protein